MNLNFEDKVVLVTGGTKGIGKQIADDLYSLGANVLITGTQLDEITLLNKEAYLIDNRRKYFQLDLLDSDSLEQFINNISPYKKIDCLVNNAGINRLNHIQESNLGDWNDMINVNLTAPYRLIKAVSPLMISNKFGRIVNIASIFGVISKEKRTIYSATKFGIHGLTVGSSNDLARHNILVNSVSPGFVLTDLTKKNLSTLEMNNLVSQIPIQRMAETNDISNVVIFLLSNLNMYLTGQNIIVDGGFTNV
jgi:NAD(P)-dependent dehydrogenase (short-subunit alcohol dehydrogenase family)